MADTMFDLSGQVALVTGSSRGIGYAVAGALGSRGATVLLNGRKLSTLQEAAQRLQEKGIRARPLVFDIEDVDATLRAVDEAEAEVGGIDILFANAAIQHREALSTFPMQEFERIMFANLTAQWALGRHLSVKMMKRAAGRIIFTGSITAIRGRRDITAYTAAKSAVHGLVRQWTAELAPHGVTVNAIAPGYIRTELTHALSNDPEFTTWLTTRTPVGQWGTPEDIASAAVFLAAKESRFVTGQIITVDGGLSSTLS